MKKPQNAGYQYEHVLTQEPYIIWKQLDGDRFVSYEIQKNGRFWKTTPDYLRAITLINNVDLEITHTEPGFRTGRIKYTNT